jgi:hypothetical protein
MTRRLSRITRVAVFAAGFTSLALVGARAAGDDSIALVAALKNSKAILQDGLRSASSDGKPISAKFEMDDGKLQLSLYTLKGDGFDEVVIDPKTGAVSSTKQIANAEDIEAASAQKKAMEKAAVPLLAVTEKAVAENAGSQAVSVFPNLKDGQPVATVTIAREETLATVEEKLN